MDCCNKSKQAALNRLKRAAGHLGKVIKMLEDDAYCIDVIQQNLAVMGHLKGANKAIFENHLETCVVDGVKSGDMKKIDKLQKEILQIIALAGK